MLWTLPPILFLAFGFNSDGASAVLLVSGAYAKQHNLPILARVLSYADAEQAPIDFGTAPSKAIPIALKRANLTTQQIDAFEINEAFAVVSLANQKVLNLDAAKLNVHGGSVALGHPLGSSGGRIVVSCLNVLRTHGGRYGCVGVCNGGGGASAMVLEYLGAHQ
jgi:acetyl-CoA C-acetyltransferase